MAIFSVVVSSVFLRFQTKLGTNTHGKSKTYEKSNAENHDMVKIQTKVKKRLMPTRRN